MKIEVISESDKGILEGFDCDKDELNQYFKQNAINGADVVTYCLYEENEGRKSVVALASLSCTGIIIESKSKFYIYPAVEIKAFAVDKEYQHLEIDKDTKWSDYAMDIVIGKIYEIVENCCGASHIVLYSVPEAIGFYRRCGFKPFEELMWRNSDRYLEGCEGMYMQLA